MNILSNHKDEDLPDEEDVRFRSLVANYHSMLTILSCDVESFVLFARRFMDKVGKLVISLIRLDSRVNVPESFSKQRDFFINNSKYNESYSKLLRVIQAALFPSSVSKSCHNSSTPPENINTPNFALVYLSLTGL